MTKVWTFIVSCVSKDEACQKPEAPETGHLLLAVYCSRLPPDSCFALGADRTLYLLTYLTLLTLPYPTLPYLTLFSTNASSHGLRTMIKMSILLIYMQISMGVCKWII